MTKQAEGGMEGGRLKVSRTLTTVHFFSPFKDRVSLCNPC